ncbi:MAG: hypothetical protein WCP39_04735 [Chlamydiota bacterium]
MKKIFIILSMVFGVSLGFSVVPPLISPQTRIDGKEQREDLNRHIEQTDQQIQELQNMKIGYEGKATRLENQAQRLQFMNKELSTSQKLWRLAESNREAAQKIQEEIDKLHAERSRLVNQRDSLP